ncbi:MAG: AAA family ATPase, partial [Fusobacteriaceae bacterium]
MRIDRVYLKNFRTHRELELNFAPGMNLLLGQNGSGKSSVLEAIGITLFDSKFRDGNSTGKDQVIKFGEKEAVIEIEFQGNDEKTYI